MTVVNDGIKSRKLWYCAAVEALTSGLLYSEFVSSDIWETITMTTLAVFVGGNVVEKFRR